MPDGSNVLRGKVVVAAFLGVSIQYVIHTAGGEELNVFAQNTDGSEPDPSAVGREVQLAWEPGHTFVVATLSDRARARSRAFLGARGLAGAAELALIAWRAAGSRARCERGRQAATPVPTVTTRRSPIGDWTFSNWPLYIDKKVLKTFDKRFGGHVKYVEDINDNDEFYGKVRQQLQAGKPIGATS